MPFKDVDAHVEDAYYIAEDKNLSDLSDRIKRILDANYEPADLDKVIQEQTKLSESEKAKLKELLEWYEELFDGMLGKWTGSQVELQLKKDAEPYHARAFPIPRCHLDTLKMEVERLCKIKIVFSSKAIVKDIN